jgi:hypothetical protein
LWYEKGSGKPDNLDSVSCFRVLGLRRAEMMRVSAVGTRPTSICRVFLLVALIAAIVPLAVAQNAKTGPKYDPTNEVTLQGTIDEVKLIGDKEPKETHLMLKTDKGLEEICLCPAKFLSDLDVSFEKGDKVKVTGAKVVTEGTEGPEVVLAREIVKGEDTLVLRDKKGGPVWTWLVK